MSVAYFEGIQLLQDFSNLEKLLNRLWSDSVPRAFSREIECSKRVILQKELVGSLERFVTQSSNPSEVLAKLQAADDPPLYCGRAFRNGEPTYSCRDCAMDPTCVLCMQCFEKSIHKKHKYRINTSGGGGYCDCGDADAWKTGPACSEHDKATQASRQDPEERLPAGMRERAEVLMKRVLSYCYDMLVWTESSHAPDRYCDRDSADSRQDVYYAMLLNDEIHTYDQVIQRLMKAIGITHKEAVEYATTVDREGRTCVFIGAKEKCDKIAVDIQRKFASHDKKILEARIMHHTLVSHQEFAQILLKWLEKIIEYSDGLRRIFCRVAMAPDITGTSLVERILVADTIFWKAIRLQFHQLFMSGVFKDVENKTRFAILFTKHYPAIYTDFAKDDHYRSVSATAVTVQLYTVSTIVKVLIESHTLIEVIMKTVIDESEKWKDEKGTLTFQRRRDGIDYAVFKRVQFALHDLKYALGCALPNLEWNHKLESSFLSGFSTFLEFFKQIQGMDAMKRFTVQHIEYEPEWETAFNIQLKIHDCIILLIRWCTSNPEVLMKAYTKVLHSISNLCHGFTSKVTVAGHSVSCSTYEVGGTDVYTSIHLPLHRLLAGLSNHLPAGVSFQSSQFSPMNQEMELFNLLEPPLRVQVLMAQVQADMWKRNGYSILNQLYYYQYVKCRQEMYDRDIQLIQYIASLMNPNSFIIHILHKFRIASVFQHTGLQFSPSVKRVSALMDEFLQLLIVILGERYVEGIGEVTEDEIIQREIVHLLSISRMSHSDLDKNLPEDPNSETNLETNVRKVAEFNRAGAGKGMYSLKDECREMFNPCFYHYSKSDQSKAEDFQRMHRKNAELDQALPIPVPPQWLPRFAAVSRLFSCDVMLHVIHTILSNMVAKRSLLRTESHFERVLHLVTLALHEDKLDYLRGNKNLSFVKACQTFKRDTDYSILDLLNQCSSSPHVTHEPIKDLLKYVLKYFSSIANIESESSEISRAKNSDSPDSAAQVALDLKKQIRAAKAAKSRMKMLERMARMQKRFMKNTSEELKECSKDAEPTLRGASSLMDVTSVMDSNENPVALGVNQTPAHTHIENYVCILCQEASTINDGSTVVYSALVQRSTVLSRNKSLPHHPGQQSSALFMPSDLRVGSFATTCGHPMHAGCWTRYYESAVAKERRRTHRALFGNLFPAFDIEKGEFFCPLCESIANTVLPVLPNFSRFQPDVPVPVSEVTLSDWLTVLTQLANPASTLSSLEETCPLPDLAVLAADTMYTNFIELYEYLSSPEEAVLSEDTSSMVVKFLLSTFTVYKEKKASSSAEMLEEPDLAPLIWNTTAYTIQVLEQLIRSDGKPLFGHLTQRQEMCISLLVRFASVCHKVIPQNIVKTHCQTLLQGLLMSQKGKPSPPSAPDASVLMNSSCIIDIDAWHYLVSLCFSMPSLFARQTYSIPAGSVNEQFFLHLLLSVHMTQIMLGYSKQTDEAVNIKPSDSMETGSTDADAVSPMDVGEDESSKNLVSVFTRLYTSIGVAVTDCPTSSQLTNHLIRASLPFLRCAALLFSNLTDVPAPPALHALCSPSDEYSVITTYLAIPSSPGELFTEEIVQILINKCADKRVTQHAAQGHRPVMSVEYPLEVNMLVDLPYDYSDLINTASLFMCPNSMGSDESRTPTMCLICKEMLCSQSYCCQIEQVGSSGTAHHDVIGAASAHALSCGAGNCIFLRVRQCQVVLLSGNNKGCFLPAPYVDDYGETDSALKRGNPLHLCKTAYRDLHRLWLSHGISEKVARSVVSTSGHLMAEWHHL